MSEGWLIGWTGMDRSSDQTFHFISTRHLSRVRVEAWVVQIVAVDGWRWGWMDRRARYTAVSLLTTVS